MEPHMAKPMDKQAKSKYERLESATGMMKVLSHPLRLSILCTLIHHGEMTAGAIVEAESPQFSQSQVSQYLGILRESGYVKTRRDAQAIYYSINDKNVKKIVETLYGIYCQS
jgi:DNA-binding transcriptional ArsR family regulator